jgi:hypothetical protein
MALLSPITAATHVVIVEALSGSPVDWMEKSPTNIDKRADDVRTISPVIFKMCFGRSGRYGNRKIDQADRFRRHWSRALARDI